MFLYYFSFEIQKTRIQMIDDSRIADLHAGLVDKDAFEKEIKVLLKEDSPKSATK